MTTTLNNSYQSQPLSVPQGGSGVVTNTTAYGLLLGGASTTGALQNAGTGSSGQIYLQVASSVGTWTNQNQIGAWQLLSTVTASSSATVAFTGLSSTYYAYKVTISAVVPATNATNFQLQVSSNNGVSYDSSSGNYTSMYVHVKDVTAVYSVNNAAVNTAICLSNAFSNTGFANNLEVLFVDPATSSNNNGISWFGKYDDSTDGSSLLIGAGSRLTTQVNNAIQFKFSSGNVASGVFKLYGILA